MSRLIPECVRRSQADRFPWAELLAVAVAFYIASAIGIPVRGFLLGAVSAMAGAAVAHPLDLVKVRLQMQTDKAMGMGAVVRPLYVTGGVAAFFKGVEATLLRQFVYSGTRFAVYEGLGTLPRLLRASVAGVVGAFVGSPAEVTCLQGVLSVVRLPSVDSFRFPASSGSGLVAAALLLWLRAS